MAHKFFEVENDNHVRIIQINRPDALNALNAELLSELAALIIDCQRDKSVRVVVLSGTEKVFAAGADIKDMHDKGFVDIVENDFFRPATEAIENLEKPLIAAVSGYALGGGCELAMMCDFIICSESAQFGQPEINLGVMAGIGGTQRLTKFVGKSKSMEMHLTGRFMNAEEAERSGLVSRIVPASELRQEVVEVAGKIAEKSSLSV